MTELSLPLKVAQAKDIDRLAVTDYGMSSLVLMENAGRGAVDVMMRESPRRVAIACGTGNNGGDGFVMARHLTIQRIPVTVLVVGSRERLTADASANLHIIEQAKLEVMWCDQCHEADLREEWLRDSDWCVDALLGTGGKGALRADLVHVLRYMRDHGSQKLAVDLPSGLDADTGVCDSHVVPADITCTFVAPKRGMVTEAGRRFCGRIEVVSIGIPPCLIEQVRGNSERGTP